MAFLTDDDYRMVVGEAALKTIAQAGADVVENAEAEAIEEISGYLRPQYDVRKIFAQTGIERNRQLVMHACDIVLYHLTAALPQRMGSEVREERYKLAVKWLEDIQKGAIVPDLPAVTGEFDDDDPPGSQIRYGSSFTQIW